MKNKNGNKYGQTLMEYFLILTFVSVVAIIVLQAIGAHVEEQKKTKTVVAGRTVNISYIITDGNGKEFVANWYQVNDNGSIVVYKSNGGTEGSIVAPFTIRRSEYQYSNQ